MVRQTGEVDQESFYSSGKTDRARQMYAVRTASHRSSKDGLTPSAHAEIAAMLDRADSRLTNRVYTK